MTEVLVEVRIDRPRADVAAYMFDPKNDADWTTGVIEATPRQPGRLAPGHRVERKVRFVGREFAYEYHVTDGAGDDFVEMEVERPFPMRIRYELEPAPDDAGGTLARIHAHGEPSGFFRLAGPMLDPMVRQNIRADLEALKRILEGEG